MAFPDYWPPPSPSGRLSVRFFASGTASADFADNAWIFSQQTGASPLTAMPTVKAGDITPETTVSTSPAVIPRNPAGTGSPYLWASAIRICNDDGAVNLEYSFDGTNVHGLLKPGEEFVYRERFEAGIALRGNGADFRCEAW